MKKYLPFTGRSSTLKSKLTRLIFVLTMGFITQSLFAQNPSLVADINSTVSIPYCSDYPFKAGNNLYFALKQDDVEGLYRLDGTEGGTIKLKDIDAISLNNGESYDFNGQLVFTASTLDQGSELWISDGTPEGTRIIKDITPGPQSAQKDEFMQVDDHLYFIQSKPQNIKELWVTDGTDAGTYLVKDLTSPIPGGTHIDQYNFGAINGKLVFVASYGSLGNELWVSDGTSAGTFALKDINPGAKNSDPAELVSFNGFIYFAAFDDLNGRTLWKTDGTSAGTVMVKDIDAALSTDLWIEIANADDQLLLSAQNTANGRELWVSDGTTSGTQLLKDINPGSASSKVFSFAVIGDVAYFGADNGITGGELWRTDGTVAGTFMVKELNPGPTQGMIASGDGYHLYNSTVSGNKFYFLGYDDIHGSEPWVTDGTPAGTVLLADVTPGTGSFPSNTPLIAWGNDKVAFTFYSIPNLWVSDGTVAGTYDIVPQLDEPLNDIDFGLVAFQEKIYFRATVPIYNYVLWSSDGTAPGTGLEPVPVLTTEGSDPSDMVKISNHQFVFSANDGVYGKELWITDGTAAGTSLLKDLTPGSGGTSSIVFATTPVNGKVFFGISNSAVVDELWVTDGTEAGTIKLADVNTGNTFDHAVANGILYFMNIINPSKHELWKTDGTVTGTKKVKSGIDVNYLASFNNEIYFSGNADGSNNDELFKTNGTAAGTALLKEINPGVNGSNPYNFAVFQNKLYFSADDGSNGRELWVTDGTAAGTLLVKDVNAGSAGSSPANLTITNDFLLFSAFTSASGEELWRSDGTATGTQLVKDIQAGSGDSNPFFFHSTGERIFFSANDETGIALFVTDGTQDGTTRVINLPGVFNFIFYDGAVVGNDFYFVLNGFGIQELWRTDGTECHTNQLDFYPNHDDECLIRYADGNVLYLSLSSTNFGVELFRYTTAPFTSYETCNGFDDDCNGIVDDNPTVTITPSGSIEECKGNPVTFSTDAVFNVSYQWNKNGNPISGGIESSFITNKNESGNFSVTINGSNGCEATSDVTSLDRLSQPDAIITPQGDLDICVTGFVNLEANAGSDLTYQWLKKDNPISGATNQIYKAKKKGDYKVVVTNADGCSKTSKKVKVTNSCKQDDETGIISTINAYPNPFSDVIHLDLSQLNWEVDQLQIFITDVSGKVVFQKVITDQNEIEIGSELIDGFYLVEVKGDDHCKVIPVVKN